MAVTAKLTWTLDSAGDTSNPPATVDVLETGSAGSGVGLHQPTSVNTTADDGLGDAMTYPAPEYYGAQCSGSHLLQLAVAAGQTTVILPSRSLSATLSWLPASANTSSPGMSMSYTVQLVNAFLGAHSTVDTSAVGNPWDPSKPRFFSGTNCSATGTAPAVSGYVTHAQLLVGGTVVKDYYDTTFPSHPAVGPNVALGTNQSSASLAVTFDSTHFADGGAVPIQMVVNDSGGSQYDATISANAYHKAYVLGNNTWYDPSTSSFVGVLAANDTTVKVTSAKYSPTKSTTDSNANIINNVPNYDAFYIATHSNVGIFGDCNTGGIGGIISAADITTAVGGKTVNQPPYNFAEVFGCEASGDSSLETAFAVNGTDQAYLGFTNTILISSHNLNWSDTVWQDLDNGQTLSAAVIDANTTYPPDTKNVNDGAAIAKIIGDSSLTFHLTVYSGTTGQWFK